MNARDERDNNNALSRRNVLLAGSTIATASAWGSATTVQVAQAQVTPSPATASIEGQVIIGGAPVAGSTVTLWATDTNAPRQLGQAQTGTDGRFRLNADSKGAIVYAVAKGGQASGGRPNGDNVALLAVLGSSPPSKVVINELTTVASAFTNARFLNGEALSGDPLALRIAAGNVPNLVDPATGAWGKVLLDPINITQNTTLANLNTLGSLIAAFATVGNDDWRNRFLKAATPIGGALPKSTLEAMAGIARTPWADPKALYALFDEAYPQPADGSRRKAPFLPYLAFVPLDFALMLCFAGGGVYAPATSGVA